MGCCCSTRDSVSSQVLSGIRKPSYADPCIFKEPSAIIELATVYEEDEKEAVTPTFKVEDDGSGVHYCHGDGPGLERTPSSVSSIFS